MMDTDEFLEILGRVWAWTKKFSKFFVETHFTCMEDLIYFCALYGSLIVIVILTALIAYNAGYDQGETEGLVRGWAGGTTFMDSGK
jgi:hypothetical protein